jgi:hypothetical protein
VAVNLIMSKECVSGCKHFDGGEIKHHEDCPYYAESLSKIFDDLKAFKNELLSDFEDDFVINGEIVDDPGERYHLLPEWYLKAKAI